LAVNVVVTVIEVGEVSPRAGASSIGCRLARVADVRDIRLWSWSAVYSWGLVALAFPYVKEVAVGTLHRGENTVETFQVSFAVFRILMNYETFVRAKVGRWWRHC